jgi:hypothetical protein
MLDECTILAHIRDQKTAAANLTNHFDPSTDLNSSTSGALLPVRGAMGYGHPAQVTALHQGGSIAGQIQQYLRLAGQASACQ